GYGRVAIGLGATAVTSSLLVSSYTTAVEQHTARRTTAILSRDRLTGTRRMATSHSLTLIAARGPARSEVFADRISHFRGSFQWRQVPCLRHRHQGRFRYCRCEPRRVGRRGQAVLRPNEHERRHGRRLQRPCRVGPSSHGTL